MPDDFSLSNTPDDMAVGIWMWPVPALTPLAFVVLCVLASWLVIWGACREWGGDPETRAIRVLQDRGAEIERDDDAEGRPVIKVFLHGEDVSDSTLAYVKAFPKLRVLSCGGAKVSDLSPLKGMKLTDLSCSYTSVADLSPLKDMPLTNLSLNKTRVTDAGLKELQTLPNLKDLSLTDTAITDVGLDALLAVGTLETLALHGSKVTNAGI